MTLPPIDSYLTTEPQPVGERCPQCGDVGRVLIDGQCFDCHDRKPPCSHCGGEGFVDVMGNDADDIREEPCDRCSSTDEPEFDDGPATNFHDADRRDDADRFYDSF